MNEKSDKLFFWATLLCGMMIGGCLIGMWVMWVDSAKVQKYSAALTNENNKYEQCFEQLEYVRKSVPMNRLIPNQL